MTTGPGPLDFRLLLPALVSWAVLAALLPRGPAELAAAAATAGVLGAAVLVRLRTRPAPGRHRGSVSTPGRPTGGPAPERRPAPDRRPVTALSLLALALVLGCGAADHAVSRAGTVTDLAAERAVVTAEARVLTEPRLVARGDERPDLVVLQVRLEQVDGRGARQQVAAPVVVFADQSWQRVPWRARVRFVGRLSPPDPGQEVVAAVAPVGPAELVGEPGPVLRGAERARERLRAAMAPLPADARGLIPGLVIGDTSLTPPELTDAMLTTGMSHLSAVSGSNVAIVLGAVVLVCAGLGVGVRWRPPLAVLALVGFVLLCRPEPSVLRAGAMGVVGLLALTTSRRRASLPALGAAVVVLLCWDPWLARSYGFALSTLATLGLVVFARPWGDAMGSRLPRPVRRLGDAVAVPLAAQVVCAPVIVLLQGTVSTVAVLANLLAAPLVAPTTIAGVGVALVAPWWLTGGVALAWVGAFPAWLIGRVARVCATVPLGTVEWLDGPAGAWLLTALTAGLLLAGPWLRARARAAPALWATGALVALAALAPLPGTSAWPPPGWVVIGCDVGQGDAFLVRAPPGTVVMVDTGPEPGPAADCVRRAGVRRLAALVLSHYHADHVGGLDGVLGAAEVAAAYVTPVREPERQATATLEALAGAGVPVTEAVAGQQYAWGDRAEGLVRATVLWPAGRPVAAGSAANNGSVVLDLRFARRRLLSTGDIESPAAREVRRALRAAPDGPGADLLKVPHHGSADQDLGLLRDVAAPVALIGVGADNGFGHPSPSVLRTLAERGTVVLRTDRHGDYALVDRDGRLAVVTRERRSPPSVAAADPAGSARSGP